MAVETGHGHAAPPILRRVGLVSAFAFLAIAVLAFTEGWSEGELTLDGPGVSLWLRFLLRHWHAGHGIPSWIPDIWAGTPVWNLVPAFPVVVLLPLASAFGPDEAVKLSTLAGHIAAAWGAFVLARSLWSRTGPAIAAGLVYGLHPFFAAAAFSGHQPFMWVFAATPWLLWSLRRALRAGGRHYIVVAGLLVGFVLVEQAELAYPLVVLCSLILAVELGRARVAQTASDAVRTVLLRAGAVVVIGLGIAAHWLVPFLASHKSFILTPPEDVRAVLEQFAGALGREPEAFLHRASALGPTYDFLEGLIPELAKMDGAAASSFYLTWVGVVLTLFTITWLAFRSGAATLNAILLASVAGLWLSMGTVPLASGGLARGGRIPALVIVALVAGLVVGNFVSSLQPRRWIVPATAVAAALLLALPFVTPVVAVQRLFPFFATIRFPRFYPFAGLGVALGAAYPLVLLRRWTGSRWPKRAPFLGALACVVMAVAFLVDIAPYRSFYRVRPPDGTAAYSAMSRRLAAAGDGSRVAPDFPGDPQRVAAALDTGRELSVGWPHHVASKDLWRLTTEAMAAPAGYRDAAFGLSNTAFLITQRVSDQEGGPQTIEYVSLQPNPRVLPLVRAYEHAVVAPGDVAPELAVALSRRYVGVVTGRHREASALGEAATGIVGSPRPCDRAAHGGGGALSGEVAMACALHNWVGRPISDALSVDERVGGRFESTVDGLQGVSVWLDRAPGRTQLTLHELEADLSVGREIRRTEASDADSNGMTVFSFEPITESAGRRYVFLLSCDGCGSRETPRMIVPGEPRGEGTLVAEDRVATARTAAFSPVYERMPAVPAPEADIRAIRPGPGRWRVAVSGARPLLIVVAESYFPGWTAEVDGKEVPVLKADGAFLGVPVGAGDHEVTLRFRRSAAVPLGYALTGLTLISCVAVLVVVRRSERRTQ